MNLSFIEPYVSVPLRDILDFDPQIILTCGHHTWQTPRPLCRGCRSDDPPCQRDVNFLTTQKGWRQTSGPLCRGCRSDDPPCQRDVNFLTTQKGWRQTSAVRERNIYPVACDVLCRPGPRLIDGVERLADIFLTHSGKHAHRLLGLR